MTRCKTNSLLQVNKPQRKQRDITHKKHIKVTLITAGLQIIRGRHSRISHDPPYFRLQPRNLPATPKVILLQLWKRDATLHGVERHLFSATATVLLFEVVGGSLLFIAP